MARREGLAVAMLCVAILGGCSRGDGPKGPRVRPAPLVAVVKASLRDVPVELRAPVDLRPLQQVDVGSKVLGYVDAVLVDRGDRVKKGQLLALVRPSDLPEQLAASRGTLAQAQASMQLARTNFDRASKLAPSGVVSQAELEQAKSALEGAEAARSAVEAQVSALAVRVGETQITSPIDGAVAARRLDPGALVGQASSGAIVTLLRDETLRVFVAIRERDAAALRLSQAAYVEVDALPGRKFEGAVVRLAPAFDLSTRTMDAEVHLDNRAHELRPGMYGRAAIVVAIHPQAVVLPVAAVQYTDSKPFAYVVSGDKVQRRALRLGTDGGDWLEILEGVAAGDEVISAGADGLSDGAAVRVVRDVDPFTGRGAALQEASSAPGAPKAP